MTNIALVVLDTLRKDAFDRHFDWLPGTYYSRAYSTANWTAPAHASLFAGRYGSELGVDAKSRNFTCEEPALAEVLSETGYRTRGLSANHNVSSKNQFDRGFDVFINQSKLLNPQHENVLDWEAFRAETDAIGPRLYLRGLVESFRGDHDTLASIKVGLGQKFKWSKMRKGTEDSGASAVLSALREMEFDADEFLFVNLMETHTPYDPPKAFNSSNESVSISLRNSFEGVDDPTKVQRAYDDAARYLSHIYERIVDELLASFDYVITLSDHGEMLGEHGLWNHTYGLYPEVTHVPLVITKPEDGTRTVRDEPVSLLDVHRTVIEIAGVDAGTSRGQDLRGSIKSLDRLAEYRGLIPNAKEGLEKIGIPDDEIEQYDATFSALVGGDGRYAIDMETTLFPEDVDADEIRARIAALQDEIETKEIEADDEELSEEVLAQLEELGYV